MKKILELLQITQEEYDQFFLDFLMKWCESVTGTDLQCQLVLASLPINRWYLLEYSKREVQFISMVNRYSGSQTVTVNDLRQKYSQVIGTMLSIAPRPLIEATKPKEIVGAFRSYGVPIKLLNFNQN